MAWNSNPQGWFGIADQKFAGHALDEERARESIAEAKLVSASKDDFKKEVVWHLWQKVPHRETFVTLCQEALTRVDHLW